MKCPVDNATLLMTERSGVEIDYCPECRGIWLDRGELDKIVRMAAAENSFADDEDDHNRYEGHNEDSHRREYGHGTQKKRRGSFIGGIFDGFGD